MVTKTVLEFINYEQIQHLEKYFYQNQELKNKFKTFKKLLDYLIETKKLPIWLGDQLYFLPYYDGEPSI